MGASGDAAAKKLTAQPQVPLVKGLLAIKRSRHAYLALARTAGAMHCTRNCVCQEEASLVKVWRLQLYHHRRILVGYLAHLLHIEHDAQVLLQQPLQPAGFFH